MVSPVTRPPPQLTMKYSEVYNGSAISRNTRGLSGSHNIEQTPIALRRTWSDSPKYAADARFRR
ncbi:hypothetical protein M0802_001503 [Mischocyttarus mexicanus]|nr:hypothetical protein M0802_001503 [Mischocyttarus mexicanus]